MSQIQNTNQAVSVIVQIAQRALLRGGVFDNTDEARLCIEALDFLVPQKPKEEPKEEKNVEPIEETLASIKPLKLAQEKIN